MTARTTERAQADPKTAGEAASAPARENVPTSSDGDVRSAFDDSACTRRLRHCSMSWTDRRSSGAQRKPQVAGLTKDAAQREGKPRFSATPEARDLVC
jgi:hypothetical protein